MTAKENLQIPMSGLCIISVHKYVCSIVVHFHVWQSMNTIQNTMHVSLMCGSLQYTIVDCMWQTI